MHALRSGSRYTTTIYRSHRHLPGLKKDASQLATSTEDVQDRQDSRQTIEKDVQHESKQASQQDAPQATKQETDEEPSALARRLEQMTDQVLESGGPRADKLIAEAGFSTELKQKLEQRLLDANFRSENAGAFAEVSMLAGAGRGTRDLASAQPWSGEESFSDTALRMLTDAHKPLRVPSGSGSGSKSLLAQNPVDLRPKRKIVDRGTRLANARDKTSIYALSQDNSMSAGEREAMRRQLQERFQPGARSIPATVQGLQSVASQRIEDAIARGLFKNIPRGKGVNVERDHNADSPFIDTTEYFMNKIVKKQDLTPPWIEKQAEIHSFAARFRGRLRADWKRHAARVIASRGGTLEEQIIRARAYARAEAVDNPPKASKSTSASNDSSGNSTIVTSEVKAPLTSSETIPAEQNAPEDTNLAAKAFQEELTLPPFRDSEWNSIEASYHTMAINQLNSLTRSYNLMAPELAKKPYFSLDRELRACYADVAPQLADEIRNRALAPRPRVEIIGHAPGSVLERFAGGEAAKVVADRRKPYGFKEFWRDLFGAKERV